MGCLLPQPTNLLKLLRCFCDCLPDGREKTALPVIAPAAPVSGRPGLLSAVSTTQDRSTGPMEQWSATVDFYGHLKMTRKRYPSNR